MSHTSQSLNRSSTSLLQRFLVAFLCFYFFSISSASAKPSSAKLIITSDITCQHQSGPDRMLSTQTIPIATPAQDGPVSYSTQYSMKGSASPVPGMNGYQLSGPGVYKGFIKDEVLNINFGQWHYQGRALNNSSKAMPSPKKPVKITLEPDTIVTVNFSETTHSIPCSGKVVYKLELKPETQTWDITLDGNRKLTYHSSVFVLEKGNKQLNTLNYDLGANFEYGLSARVVLTKKKKQWVYTSGTVVKSMIDYEYFQVPLLYKVNNIFCQYCDKVKQLKGKPLDGEVLDDTLILFWPEIEPVVIIDSQLNPIVKCAPGEAYATCQRQLEKASTRLEISDSDFLQRTSGHLLPLRNGFYDPAKDTGMVPNKKKPKGASMLEVNYRYNLTRVE